MLLETCARPPAPSRPRALPPARLIVACGARKDCCIGRRTRREGRRRRRARGSYPGWRERQRQQHVGGGGVQAVALGDPSAAVLGERREMGAVCRVQKRRREDKSK